MYPALTCMDKVTVRNDTPGADIEVGDIITFFPPSEECYVPLDSHIIHRVMAKWVEFGTIWNFRTKGDSNRFDDGCSIPYEFVTGVVTNVEKDAYPELQPLVDMVTSARNEFRAAERSYDSSGDLWYSTWWEFLRVVVVCDRYACYEVWDIVTYSAAVDFLDAADAHEAEWEYFSEVVDWYNDTVDCAVDQAIAFFQKRGLLDHPRGEEGLAELEDWRITGGCYADLQ